MCIQYNFVYVCMWWLERTSHVLGKSSPTEPCNFLFNIFNLWLIEFVATKPTDMEGQLYLHTYYKV